MFIITIQHSLQIRSAKLNLIHGDRLGNNDLANVVLKILKARPIEKITGFVKEMGKQFDLDSTTIGRLGSEDGTISEVVEKLKLGRDVKIWKLLMLGWGKKEAGSVFGVTPSTMTEIYEKLQTQDSVIQNSYYKDKKTIEQIKEFNHLDEITTWGIILKGKDNLERQEKVTLYNQISRYIEPSICMESTTRIECRRKTLYGSKKTLLLKKKNGYTKNSDLVARRHSTAAGGTETASAKPSTVGYKSTDTN